VSLTAVSTRRLVRATERACGDQTQPGGHQVLPGYVQTWCDAACVGASTPQTLRVAGVRPLGITARGHGSRQLCRTDRYGFPTRHRGRAKCSFGMSTGDIVRAAQPRWMYAGTYVGRVTIRQRPSFHVNGHDFPPRLLTVLQRADGYDYTPGVRASGAHSHSAVTLR
jgi:hypothetical protein